ncbi:MAG: AraC family transcriptional regulator [Stappiaceae bacterium]
MDTKRLNEARQIVSSKFCDHRLEVRGSGRKFHARHSVATGRLLSLNYLSYGETVLIEPGELQTFYLIQIPVRGHADITNGNLSFLSSSKNASILNPDRHTRMIWHASCEQLLVYLPKSKLKRFAEKFLGRVLDSEIVFQPEIDFSNPDLAGLRRAAVAFAGEADHGHLFGESASLNQLLHEERFIADLLLYQPSNVRCFASALSRSAPAIPKRARDYIVENLHHSIGLSEIATAAHAPIRTLQHQFKCFYDMSPTEFLKQERLRRIHSELSSGHCSANIRSLANRWGFHHQGRFSKHYEQQFGELPSKTKSKAHRCRFEKD